MRTMRVAFMAVLIAGVVGCGFVDSQLARDPQTGKSRLESEVDTAKPLIPTPWGEIAGGAALLITSVYGAFHAREANKQTDKPQA